MAAGCPEDEVYQRGTSQLKVQENSDFSDFGDEEAEAAVQVKPQVASVALRAGKQQKYNI